MPPQRYGPEGLLVLVQREVGLGEYKEFRHRSPCPRRARRLHAPLGRGEHRFVFGEHRMWDGQKCQG